MTVDRFAAFTGWELQCLAIGVDAQEGSQGRDEQRRAQAALMSEIHEEFDRREELGFTDPEATREPGRE